MDSSLQGVIIGALISAIPNILSMLMSRAENKAARKHELQKLDIDLYHKEKINALKSFRLAYSDICENITDPDKLVRFRSAAEILDMFVSEKTHELIRSTYYEIRVSHNNYLINQYDPSDFSFSLEHDDALLVALRTEMDTLHRSSGFERSTSFEICSPPSVPVPVPDDQLTQPPAAS